MTKKKKILNGIIFLVGLIVFLFYYFEDNADMEKIEHKQDQSAEEAAEDPKTGLDAISEDVAEFEQDSAMIEQDNIAVDSI